jgi:hypothetical protein
MNSIPDTNTQIHSDNYSAPSRNDEDVCAEIDAQSKKKMSPSI